MPLSEFLRLAIEKLESSRKKQCSTDLSSPRAENDLSELKWENGQITTQDQSSRAPGSPAYHGLQSNAPRVRDAAVGDSTPARVGKFGEVDSILHDSPPVVPSGNLDLTQSDEMAHWLSYPVDDDGMQDYCSDLLPEISGVTADRLSAQNSFDQVVDNSSDSFKISSSKARPSCSWLPAQQGETSDPSIGPRVPNVISNNNTNFLNFSHFARPVNLVKAKLPSSPPTVVHSSELVAKELFLAERTENLCKETFMKDDNALVRSNTANSTAGVTDSDRSVEPMVGCSSVDSGNSGDRVSCENTHNSKRKFLDIEEFECHSEDIETESIGVPKRIPAQGATGSKRSRAAEVHNLSERRRRDRINEKMRALQELIPNCNKADKASMLDEAIEYLKSLQLQVQMMSMGAGLCMPPMMFHPGAQHMHPAHVPHFPPMRVGMGYGVGMQDIKGGTGSPHRYPFFPIPPMQRAQFPSPISGPTNFPIMPGSNLPVYGHPSSVSRVPLVPLTARPQINSAMSPRTSPKLSSEDQTKNKNSHFKNNAESRSSINQRSNKLPARNEALDQSAALQEKTQSTDVVSTSAPANDTSKRAGCD